jgi:hypothetical protein
MSRAVGTLLPLLLISFGAGLWMGWIKWHTWKKEYSEVERDYHKLHDIHDVARQTIPELEGRREALTQEIGQLEDLLGKIKEANESYEAESFRLNENLRATKRNYEAMEDIWRGKIAKAEIRIIELETALSRQAAPPQAPSLVEAGTMESSGEETADHRLIPFPPPEGESAGSAQEESAANASHLKLSAANKARSRRAI